MVGIGLEKLHRPQRGTLGPGRAFSLLGIPAAKPVVSHLVAGGGRRGSWSLTSVGGSFRRAGVLRPGSTCRHLAVPPPHARTPQRCSVIGLKCSLGPGIVKSFWK